jgi:hypothetical protein
VQRTSLQDIASRLGITKTALYYHFDSRDELVRGILQPLIDDGERYIAEQVNRPATDPAGPRELLEGYLDFHFQHRADLDLVVSELTTLADLALVDKLLAWRGRLVKLVFAQPTLAQSARGVIAFGGLQDCCLQFPDTPMKTCARRRWRGHLRRWDYKPRSVGLIRRSLRGDADWPRARLEPCNGRRTLLPATLRHVSIPGIHERNVDHVDQVLNRPEDRGSLRTCGIESRCEYPPSVQGRGQRGLDHLHAASMKNRRQAQKV